MISLTGSSHPFLNYIFSLHSFLLSTPLTPSLPFSLFAVIHATRIACAYRGAAKAGGYDHKLSLIHAALVPCILIFGGTTITGALLGQVPGWVISPIPLLTYGLLPVLAAKTGLTSTLLSLPALPRDIVFSLIDGFSRVFGITTLGVDTVLSHPNPAVAQSPWAMVVIATLAGGGGGLIIPLIGGFGPEWAFTTPYWVRTWPAVDVWGATLIGYVYATLIDAHPFFRLLPVWLTSRIPGFSNVLHLPKGYLAAAATGAATKHSWVPGHEAKTACSLLLASILITKTILVYLLYPSPSPSSSSSKRNPPAPIVVGGGGIKKPIKTTTNTITAMPSTPIGGGSGGGGKKVKEGKKQQ